MSKKIISVWTIISCLAIGLTVISCEENDGEQEESFDRKVLLTDMAESLIIPNFETLQASVNILSSGAENFSNSPTISNLETLRNAWKQAAIDFQHCSAFGFGPADLTLGPIATVIAVFPVDENQVEANIINPDFDLENSFDRDVRGLYTVEYLIYGKNESDQELIAGFDPNRIDYLLLIVGELKTTVDNVVSEWKGDYLQEFTSNDGTSAGSPISLFYNEFVKDYENLKNFKVELPAGLTAGQSRAQPELVEAYYSGISSELIFNHFENSKNIWYGRSRNGQNITGFEEYLTNLVGGPELIEITTSAISEIDNSITALPNGPLADNIESAEVEQLRDNLQRNTANFKSSLSSLLGISITFNSGDGD